MEDFPKIIAARKATVIVGRLIFKEDKPVEATVAIGKLNPMKIIEYCNNFLPDQFSPGREFSGKSTNSLRTIPKIKAKTLEPMMGRKFPITWRKEPVQMQLQVQILYFSFSRIPFKKSAACSTSRSLTVV